jgi:hypothetical protein
VCAGTLTVRAPGRGVVGSLTFRLSPGRALSLRVPLNARGRSLLRRLRGLTVDVTATVRDRASAAASVRRRFVLRAA